MASVPGKLRYYKTLRGLFRATKVDPDKCKSGRNFFEGSPVCPLAHAWVATGRSYQWFYQTTDYAEMLDLSMDEARAKIVKFVGNYDLQSSLTPRERFWSALMATEPIKRKKKETK